MNSDEDYKRVISFVMGTRWDLVPASQPTVQFSSFCTICKAVTYTEKEFPQEATIICNVCAAARTNDGDIDPQTAVVWEIPPDLLGRLVSEAKARGIHPENYVIGFLEWKTGRELPQIRLFNREDKQIYIVQKRL